VPKTCFWRSLCAQNICQSQGDVPQAQKLLDELGIPIRPMKNAPDGCKMQMVEIEKQFPTTANGKNMMSPTSALSTRRSSNF
jgi:hypothetical protein